MRIIAGRLGGRRLPATVPTGTRPTTDRVREALFSMLDARAALTDTHVLDLCAGTGALGLEALSRGARSVVAVDRAPQAIAAIRKNAAALGLDELVCCVRGDVASLNRAQLSRGAAGGCFDLVLIDPPYADMVLTRRCLDCIAQPGLLSANALISLEVCAQSALTLPSTLSELARKRYGDSAIVLLAAMA